MWKIAVTITVLLVAGLAPAAVLADAERNREAGEAFLDSNSEKDDVTVTASGLQYLVLVEGDATAKGESKRKDKTQWETKKCKQYEQQGRTQKQHQR